MEKLIEYKKIKGAALLLRDRYINSGDIYTKKPEIIEVLDSKIQEEDIFKNTTLLDLYNIYNNLIENFFMKQNKENVIQRKIYVDKYKIEDKMNDLLKMIDKDRILKFKEIIAESECKLEAVVSFLALLELIKLRIVKAYQDNNFDDIIIERRLVSE